MPHPPFREMEGHICLVGDPDRWWRRQVHGEGAKHVFNERPGAEHHLVHLKQPREFRLVRPPDGKGRAVESQREPAACPRRVGEHGHDVGEHLVGDGLLEFRLLEQLNRLDRPGGIAVGPVAERGLHVDGVAHPRIAGPGAADPHHGVFDVELQRDGSPARSLAPRRLARLAWRQDRVEIGAMFLVKDDVGAEPLDPHAAEVAGGEQDAGEPVLHLHPVDLERSTVAIAGHDREVFKHDRAKPPEPHAGRLHVGGQFGDRGGDEFRHPFGRAEDRG